MMSTGCGWGWESPPTRHIQSDWAHWYAVHCHMVAALHSYTYPLLGLDFEVLCHLWRVNIMTLRHGWAFQPPQTASHLHIRCIQSVWVHWYAIHWHTSAALNSCTHPTWLRFLDSVSLVESKWCDYVMDEADSHLKLLPISILLIYNLFGHIDMLSIGIQQQP